MAEGMLDLNRFAGHRKAFKRGWIINGRRHKDTKLSTLL